MNSTLTMLMDIAFTNVNIVIVKSGSLDLFGMGLIWDASLRYNENCPEVIIVLIARMKKNLKQCEVERKRNLLYSLLNISNLFIFIVFIELYMFLCSILCLPLSFYSLL